MNRQLTTLLTLNKWSQVCSSDNQYQIDPKVKQQIEKETQVCSSDNQYQIDPKVKQQIEKET